MDVLNSTSVLFLSSCMFPHPGVSTAGESIRKSKEAQKKKTAERRPDPGIPIAARDIQRR